MREIGSEFWSVPTAQNKTGLFPADTVWYLSGRSALRAIVRELKRDYKVKSIAVPSWCCDSMLQPLLAEEVSFEFYPVYVQGGTLCRDLREDCDALLVMDYFGYGNSSSPEGALVVRDLTHSLLSRPCADGDYFFGSLRKWCGIYTGGYAWKKEGKLYAPHAESSYYSRLRKQAMEEKARYIAGKTDSKAYLEKFAEAEALLDPCAVLPADARDLSLAETLDADAIRARRRENAAILLDLLAPYALFPELGAEDCPLFVPILVKNRDELKKYLISQNIYCPAHWPRTSLHRLDERTEQLYTQELSLICDQRYGAEDMQRLAEFVKRGIELC